MLISHKHKFVFVHNPKVGGTSIRKALMPFCEQDLYHAKLMVDDEVQDAAHLRVDQWTDELVKAYVDGYYFFGVVKDPVDRYRSAMSEIQFQHPDFIEAFGFRSREEFLYTIMAEGMARNDWRFCHFCPQWTYFTTGPRYGLLPGIEIFRLEEIETWWPKLGAKLGVELKPHLDNNRPSYYKPQQLKMETLALIRDLYSDDYKLFGYQPQAAVVPGPRIETSAQRIDYIAKFGIELPDTRKHKISRLRMQPTNKREWNAFEKQDVKLRSFAVRVLNRELSHRSGSANAFTEPYSGIEP